ncbi:MAG: hypothetical protein IPK16_11455 [Anaerolineales bacterium]|nr:hypothetical protein [Anaerolineales bacterium]
MHRFSSCLYALLIVLLGVLLAFRSGFAAAPRQDTLQVSTAGVFALPVLLPVSTGATKLHTHIVDLAITPAGDGNLQLDLQATYAFRNEGSEDTTVEFTYPAAGNASVVIYVDDTPLLLTSGDDGGLVGTVVVPAESTADVLLVGSWRIPDQGLIKLLYPTDLLKQWPGSVSLRFDLRPDPSIPPESWLRVEPEGWAYAPPEIADSAAIEWLYDGNPPDALLFQAFSPAQWSQVVQAEAAVRGDAPPDAAIGLGKLYRQLAADAAAGGDAAASERFYAQALAAFETGIRKASAVGASATQTAPLHAGLAELYRSRVVDAAGATNVAYAELMVKEAGLALQGLMADDGVLRPELERWRAEGLRLLLTDARRRGDVDNALAIIDRLGAADVGASNAEFLASERRALVIQQALELMVRGDRAGAEALAGEVINDATLQAPADLQPLFLRWAIDAAVNGDGIDLRVRAYLNPQRAEAGRDAFTVIMDNWRSAGRVDQFNVELSAVQDAGAANPFLELVLRIPKGETGVPMGELLPTSADWALLRQLLVQLGPRLENSSQGLYQQVQMSQPIDLRPAGVQWETAAQRLEQQADALEAEAQATGAGVDATMASSLQLRVRAANLRQTSENWRTLGRDSVVRISLSTSGSVGNAARTWLITVNSAPQMLDVIVEALSPGRVAILFGSIFSGARGARQSVMETSVTQYSLSESKNAALEDGAGGVRYRPFQYRDSVYFQDGQWLTALFGFILYLLLAIALDAAGHVQSLAIVIPVTAAAFLLGVLMSFSRFDGFFALSYSMFVGLACILYLMAGIAPAEGIAPFLDGGIGELQARVYYILLRLLDWVDAALSGSPSADNYVFIFEICFLMWWLAYLGAWSIFRHGYTWRAVVPAGVVLLINTYYAPKSTVALLGAFIIVALVLLIRTNLADQQLRWRAQHVYFNQDITWDFLRNGVLFSVLVVLAAWLLPGLGRNPQMREFLEPVNDRWESTAQSVQRLYQGLNQQERQAPANFGNSLALGGERNVGDSPVFEVSANKARYWRAVTFDTYDGLQWFNTANEETSYGAGEIIPVASWRAREAISQTVSILAPVGDVLFGAPDVAQSDIRMKATIRTQAGASPIAAANPQEGSPAVEFAVAGAPRSRPWRSLHLHQRRHRSDCAGCCYSG